ncbi:MAG TPA: serine protease [Oculatellaceae cyanobacterium]
MDLYNHVKTTWDHVLHGESTVGEKAEVAVESAAAAIALFAGGGKVVSMFRTGEKVLPSLELVGNAVGRTASTATKEGAFGTILSDAMMDSKLAAAARAARTGESVIPTFRLAGTVPNLTPEVDAIRVGASSPEAKLYASMSKSVVRIKAGNKVGSGLLLDERTIVTDDHVAVPNGRLDEIKIHFEDGTTGGGVMVARDGNADLALVRLHKPVPSITPIKLAGENDFNKIGKVALVSHPDGVAKSVLSEGRVTEIAERPLPNGARALPEIHCALPNLPGSSGGPLCKVEDGTVLGILSGSQDGGTIAVSTSAPNISLLHNALKAAEKDGPLAPNSWVELRSFGKIWTNDGVQIKVVKQSSRTVDIFDGLALLRRRRYVS